MKQYLNPHGYPLPDHIIEAIRTGTNSALDFQPSLSINEIGHMLTLILNVVAPEYVLDHNTVAEVVTDMVDERAARSGQ